MLADLHLQNYRSYIDDSFEFTSSVNIIVGPNASGKTNLLEAILVLARGSSYRAKDSELIAFNKEWARLDANLNDGDTRTVKLNPAANPVKTYEIEHKVYKRLTLSHSIPVVLFEPNHLQLLSGGPERRREYLDDLLSQTIVGYSGTVRQYKRALAQRNTLLKQPSGNIKKDMFPWNVRLSELAGQIIKARAGLAEELNAQVGILYKELSKTKTEVSIEYAHKWPTDAYESSMLNELEVTIDADMVKGFTGVGPHREDLVVRFDNHPAQDVASRGEVRTVVLALKITEMKILEEARDLTPLLLLDDVFSELDGKRRHALTDHLSKYQTFITTTDADLVLQHFTAKTNVIPLV